MADMIIAEELAEEAEKLGKAEEPEKISGEAMEICAVCDKSGEEVKLLDGISFGEIIKICEHCSLVENIPVIRKPSTSQLKESERPYTVSERLKRMAGLTEEKQEITKIAEEITEKKSADEKPKTYEEELKEKFDLAKERNIPLKLIDNFHWHVLMARKKKKLTRRQLAELLGEAETAIKMIEDKKLPDDPEKILRKLEQYFRIKLIEKPKEAEEIEIEKLKKEKSKEREVKLEEEPEEKAELKLEEKRELEKTKPELKPERAEETELKPEVRAEARQEELALLKFDRESRKSIQNLTIADLKRMKDEKEKYANKEEKEKLKREEAEKKVRERKEEMSMKQLKEMVWRRSKEKEKQSLIGNEIEIIEE